MARDREELLELAREDIPFSDMPKELLNEIGMALIVLPKENISDIVKRLKGRSSRKIQQEFPEQTKRYWG